jgi:predicted outer membrane lipoprotein
MDITSRAVATAAVAALVAVAAFLGEVPLIALAGILSLTFAVGWPPLADLPQRVGASIVIGLGGIGAVLTIALTTGEPFLRGVPLAIALAIVAAFVNELLRRDGRERLVESVSGVVAGVLVAASVAGWVAAGRTTGGASLVVTGAVALAAGAALSALPVAGWGGALLTIGAAVGAGAGIGQLVPDIGYLVGGLIGLSVGILVATLLELFDRLPTLSGRWAAIAAVVLPVTVTGFLVYVVGRVLLG